MTEKIFLLIIALCFLEGAFAFSQNMKKPKLVSGKPIPVGAANRLGPLAAPGVHNYPIGVAFVFESKQPDLFVKSVVGVTPGLYLYRWITTTPNQVPVFGERISIKSPFSNSKLPPGTIFQTKDGKIHGVWFLKNDLIHTVYSREEHKFVEAERVKIEGLPRSPGTVSCLLNHDGSVEILLGISDGVRYRPKDWNPWVEKPQPSPYDGKGIWRGGIPYVSLYVVSLPKLLSGEATNLRLVSKTKHEVRFSYQAFTVANLGYGRERDVITGSRYGGLHYYHNTSESGVEFSPRLNLIGRDEIILRHPTILPTPVAYPNPVTGLSDLIVGGEGALYYYRFTESFSKQGKPIYEKPTPVLEQNANLYSGSLTVPNVVDWNGDGFLDIISGNSEGRILFFRNVGTNSEPAFLSGVPLKAGGQEIHIQPGYRMDIQGPGEARWGYTCPTVVDWNEDGLPDILMSDSTARHTVYINRGTKTEPKLDAGHPLYLDGLELQGTWRVKPAVAKLGERMAYVALDGDDEFHLYWRLDDYNLEDGGKLKLEDGSAIGANYQKAGGTGRLKLNLVDWDCDGKVDLIVGTHTISSVPNPEKGLPHSLDKPGATVLFLRNIGSNQQPIFQFPNLIKFREKPISLGTHSCSPAVANFGNSREPDLIVGEERGRFIFYKREELSFD